MTSSGELLLHPAMAHGAPLRGLGLTLVLALIAALAVIVPAGVVLSGGGHHAYRNVVEIPRRVVPRAELPPVEPVKLVEIAPDDARAYNAEQPFVAGRIAPARAFRFTGGPDDRARATDCLAAAVIYEAGDDAAGEKAVAQVVLNRLRHPAFPKSVCGVVFEGSERTTGCQFTFSCDGALTRWHPTEAGWKRAREVATAALAGSVDKQVGYATHYHTDWVVPYWQASLDKIAAVHTHLFFRWTGWWGTAAAFDRQPLPVEPVIAKLASLSPAHGGAVGVAGGAMVTGADGAVTPLAPLFGRTLKPMPNDPDTFVTALDPGRPLDSYKAMALQACGERPHCKVLGWTDVSSMDFALPLTADAQSGLSFSYLRDRASGFDKALWNCAEFRHVPPGACMKRAAVAKPPAGPVLDPNLKADDALRGVPELGGVRRRSGAAAAPAAEPNPRSP